MNLRLGFLMSFVFLVGCGASRFETCTETADCLGRLRCAESGIMCVQAPCDGSPGTCQIACEKDADCPTSETCAETVFTSPDRTEPTFRVCRGAAR